MEWGISGWVKIKMKTYDISFRKVFKFILIGMLISAMVLSFIAYNITNSKINVIFLVLLAMIFLVWTLLLIFFIQNKLVNFTGNICKLIDDMMSDKTIEIEKLEEEKLLSRVNYKLQRLYTVLKKSRNKVENDKKELEKLITDISHQVRIPVSNLKIINDTLVSNKIDDIKKRELLVSSNTQIDKLDFLMESMIKISRLETGLIKLSKQSEYIYETIVSALNGVLFKMEDKCIDLTLSCSEDILVFHDVRWTIEALFNLLDNAVKYTNNCGSISIEVEQWELYTKIDIEDSGKGISEKEYSNIFKRFYREESVYDIEGIGVGLYLAREIIMQQGGYIKVRSELGKGTVFSVFLLNE